ncbi:MAG TPA: hypothetical protein VFE98_01120 [Candidatus Bathyarchaeia archaeon]|nr:hypothetical protein [Candidatus Bathyarchaeia archaeon]
MGWSSGESTNSPIYQATLVTSILEYFIVLFFGGWLIVEFLYNSYEQKYFGSYDPVFLIVVLMTASAYGFGRLISTARTQFKPRKNTTSPEDDI